MFDFVTVEATIQKIATSSGISNAQAEAITQQIVTEALAPVKNTLDTMQTALNDEHNVEQSLLDRVAAVETALTDTVNHLAAGNTDAASAAATAALPGNASTSASSGSTGDTASSGAASDAGADTAEKSNN